MKTVKNILAVCALVGMVGLVAHNAIAATVGDTSPKATYGAVQVATASATAMWTTGTSGTALTGRNAYIIFNHGPNTIWCGFDSAVTNVTGFPVGPETALSVDLTYISSNNKLMYCRADTALQATPLDTRWIQVK